MSGVHIHPLDVAGQILSVATVSGAAAGSPGQAVAGVTGTVIRVFRLLLTVTSSGGAVSVMSSGTNGNSILSGQLEISANGSCGLLLPFDGTPWFNGVLGGNLVFTGGGLGAIQGLVYFTQTSQF